MRFTLYIHISFSRKLAPTRDDEGVGGIDHQPPLRKISAPKREDVTAPPSKGGGRRRLEAGRKEDGGGGGKAYNAFGQVRRLVI